MKLRLIALPILALAGFGITVVAVIKFNAPPAIGPEPIAPTPIPFLDRVAGVGIVEPASETILLGAPVGGIIAKIFVTEGESVTAGQALIELDTRDAEARIYSARARVQSGRSRVNAASARIAQLDALPRAEDVAQAAALVSARQASLADAQGRLDRLLGVGDRGTTANEQPTLEFGVAIAAAQLIEAEAKLARVEAGAYPEERAVAESDAQTANSELLALEAELRQAEVTREILVVRAPIAGTVLRIDTHVGEFKASGQGGGQGGAGNSSALLRLGNINTLHVRTDIDELDSWRFDSAGKALAIVRGGSRQQVALHFVRVVPDVAPKRTLTGENGERIDTRVVQVIYAMENPPPFVQPGMLVDVAVASKSIRDVQ